MIKKILVTGADGMLGTDVVQQLQRNPGYKVIPTTIEQMDITNLEQVKTVILKYKPQVLIHCASYTAVDEAEKNQDLCFAVNVQGTINLANFCRNMHIEMVYISTDYVFDGEKETPYVETDEPHPLNVYGKSKLQGEHCVQEVVPRHKIVRTSWLCGLNTKYGLNFIEKILKRASEQEVLYVVNDQRGKPTFTFHLAKQLALLLEVKEYGIFHITNDGICSWFEFAQEIVKVFGLPNEVRPIKSDEFPVLARRPKNSALENARLKELGLPLLPHWRRGLIEYYRRRESSLLKKL